MEFFKSMFPAGLVVSECINKIDDIDAYLKLNRTQISKGDFISYHNVFHTWNIQLGFTRRSMRIAIHGDVPLDSIFFAMIINDATMIQQKNIITKHHLAILEHGGEINAIYVEPINILTVCVNRDLFRNKYEKKFLEVYPAVLKSEIWLCDEKILQTTKYELMTILDAALSNKNMYTSPENMNIIENIIIDHMLTLIHARSTQHKEEKSIAIAHSLLHLLQSKSNQEINIEILSKELRVSQRNVYLTFQKHYHITPKQYHLCLRLGNIKKVLNNADPKNIKIEHIAMSNGFYHMSHFAKIYKNFFGELPSQTLWKNKN